MRKNNEYQQLRHGALKVHRAELRYGSTRDIRDSTKTIVGVTLGFIDKQRDNIKRLGRLRKEMTEYTTKKFECQGKRKSSSTDHCGGEGNSPSSTSRKVTLFVDGMGVVNDLVKAPIYWEQSRGDDLDTALIRQTIRRVVFRASLEESGQEQLKHLRSERTRWFTGSLAAFQGQSSADREEVLACNMQLAQTHQPVPPLRVGEVKKLKVKLRSLNVPGLDRQKKICKQSSMGPFLQAEEAKTEFTKIPVSIEFWPQNEK